MRAEHDFDVGTNPVSKSGDQLGGIRPEIVLRAPDEPGARAQSEKNFCGGGVERNDARRSGTNPNRIPEVVAHGGAIAARLLTRGKRE